MPSEAVRYMYLLVFFDLPVTTKAERREASLFRRFLLGDGYDMVQFSVYSRICRGRDAVDTHYRRLKENLPSSGCVRLMQVTEQQYGRMKILVGKRKKQEKIAPQQLLLF